MLPLLQTLHQQLTYLLCIHIHMHESFKRLVYISKTNLRTDAIYDENDDGNDDEESVINQLLLYDDDDKPTYIHLWVSRKMWKVS